MNPEEITKNILSTSEKLKTEYVEKIRALINESYSKIEADNKEILNNINITIDNEVSNFQNELEDILNETLRGLEKRNALLTQKVESSEISLKEKFSNIFSEIYEKIKNLLT